MKTRCRDCFNSTCEHGSHDRERLRSQTSRYHALRGAAVYCGVVRDGIEVHAQRDVEAKQLMLQIAGGVV